MDIFQMCHELFVIKIISSKKFLMAKPFLCKDAKDIARLHWKLINTRVIKH